MGNLIYNVCTRLKQIPSSLGFVTFNPSFFTAPILFFCEFILERESEILVVQYHFELSSLIFVNSHNFWRSCLSSRPT